MSAGELAQSTIFLDNHDTPKVPRGKRSDLTESDRDLFASSYGKLLKLLDEADNRQKKHDIGEDIIENIMNA
jgi:ADP-glucose pyrophosphorylase